MRAGKRSSMRYPSVVALIDLEAIGVCETMDESHFSTNVCSFQNYPDSTFRCSWRQEQKLTKIPPEFY